MAAALMSLIWGSCLNSRVLKTFFPVSIETGRPGFNTHVGQTNVCHQVRVSSGEVNPGADKPQPSIPRSPACLLRLWLILGVDDPFPRGRKRAAPFTVRKLSLMLQGKRQTRSEEKCLVFKKEESNEQDRLKALNACSVLWQWSDLDQMVLLVKNFSPHVSTASIQSITENNTIRETLKSRTYAGATLPAEVQPEQAEGINLWLHFRFESQDDRSTFLNGDEENKPTHLGNYGLC